MALSRGGELIGEQARTTDRRHDETLSDMTIGMMQQAGVAFPEIDLLAVSIGPGSFTGLRVGLSYAKGVALGAMAQLIPVGTLEGLAESMRETASRKGVALSSESFLCPMTIARKGESFGQLFGVDGQQVVVKSDPFLCNASNFSEHMDELNLHDSLEIIVGGEGADVLWDDAEVEIPMRVTHMKAAHTTASAISRIAISKWLTDTEIPKADTLEPYYLKEFTIRSNL